MDQARFEEWALVEVMGHQSFVGYVTETQIGGAAMVRVDVPEVPATETRPGEPAFTKYFGGGSIYSITPISEEFARAAAARRRDKPHNIYVPELYPQEIAERPVALIAGGTWPLDNDGNPDWFDPAADYERDANEVGYEG